MSGGSRRIRGFLRSHDRPLVLGHRGARARAPENTLLGFDRAMNEGADGIELDVRLDRDGDVVVIHDPSLLRVTGGTDARNVEEVGRKELLLVDVGNGEIVPRLEDVLRWAFSRGAKVNVELKKDVTRRARLVASVARVVAVQPHAAEWILFSSFDPGLVRAMAMVLPWIPSGWLVDDSTPFPGRSARDRLVLASAIHPRRSLVTAERIQPWKDAGLGVNVWTVNDPEEARRLDALGVDAIITDMPGEILAGLGK